MQKCLPPGYLLAQYLTFLIYFVTRGSRVKIVLSLKVNCNDYKYAPYVMSINGKFYENKLLFPF